MNNEELLNEEELNNEELENGENETDMTEIEGEEDIEEVTENSEELQEEEQQIESTLSNDILVQLTAINETLDSLTAEVAQPSQTIWEKPIEEYTPSEGILLIIMFLVLGRIVFDWIGGIICLKR